MAKLKSGTTIAGSVAWHGGNDGAGSGLDADLLDGQQGSFYLNATNISNTSGTLLANCYKENLVSSTGGAKSFDLSTGSVFWHSMTGSGAFSFTNTPASNTVQTVTIVTQQSTANSVITWPAAVLWPGNVQPTQSTALNEIDFWSITVINKGGTLYYLGNLVAKDAS